MPKTHLDWFGIAALWFGAALMAIKSAGFALTQGAPAWLAANWWNYVPLFLLSIYFGIAIYRALRPPKSLKTSIVIPENLKTQTENDHFARESAIYSIKSAKNGINHLVNSRNNRDVELKLHEVRAALLTANRQFGLPQLPALEDTRLELKASERLIELVLPYLEEQHIGEARTQAQAFLDKFSTIQNGASGA